MKRILVVDDEIGALTLIGIMLERGGFEVLKAKDADQAQDVLELETPDLIILDVMMPMKWKCSTFAEKPNSQRFVPD